MRIAAFEEEDFIKVQNPDADQIQLIGMRLNPKTLALGMIVRRVDGGISC